jgi:hypothetical protein
VSGIGIGKVEKQEREIFIISIIALLEKLK